MRGGSLAPQSARPDARARPLRGRGESGRRRASRQGLAVHHHQLMDALGAHGWAPAQMVVKSSRVHRRAALPCVRTACAAYRGHAMPLPQFHRIRAQGRADSDLEGKRGNGERARGLRFARSLPKSRPADTADGAVALAGGAAARTQHCLGSHTTLACATPATSAALEYLLTSVRLDPHRRSTLSRTATSWRSATTPRRACFTRWS